MELTNPRGAISLIVMAGVSVLAAAARAEPPLPATPPQAATEAQSPPADASAKGESGIEPDRRINFTAEIQPILAAHCFKCHGPEKRSGGLRLDEAQYAKAGGDSGATIVGGTLATNELFRRVSSTERATRMPKNAAALPDEQIALVQQWVEEGAAWPEPTTVPPEEGIRSTVRNWLFWFAGFADRYQYEYEYILPYAVAFMVAQLGLLLVARAKAAYTGGRRWATGRLRWFGKFSSNVSSRELILCWLLVAGGLGLAMMQGHQRRLARDLAKLEAARPVAQDAWASSIYGSPPAPFRPTHPKQVAGTYYRGNCERNKELFNGGNYLTCTFRVNLCDADGKSVGVNDPLPEGGLYVRMEIERAPGTPDSLFSEEMMRSVFLSPKFYDSSGRGKLLDEPARLETLEAGRRWAARVALGSPDKQGALDGLIYVYTGRIEKGTARGEPQYAIKYELRFADKNLTAESDLWMSSFGNGAVAPPPRPGLIPFTEWFDYRPIPAITGENTKDPKLLGVEEYVKKGLIKPEPEPEPKPDD